MAMFAFSAVGAASASAALPEFLHCTKVANNVLARFQFQSTCNALEPEEPVLGGWEELGVLEGEKLPFESTSGAGTLETKGGEKISCTSDSDTGEITGPKSVSNVSVTFKGCSTTVFKFACTSSGQASGVIKTNLLKGEIGYLNKSKKEVGLELEPETSGGFFAEFECAGIVSIKVRGHVIGKITPVNTMTDEYDLVFEQASGVQKYTEFEGGPAGQVLESTKNGGSSYEQSGEETSDKVITSEEGEIAA